MRLFCGNACWQVARRGSRVKTTVPTSELLLFLERTEG